MQQGLRSLRCLSFSFPAEAQRRPYYADYSPARKYIHTLCTSHYLDLFITFIIGVNVITMSMEHYNQPKVRAVHGCVGWETQQGGVAEDPRTPFPWSIPWWLKASAGYRLSIATHLTRGQLFLTLGHLCLTLDQLYHLGITCPSQKLDFPALA